MKRGRAKEADIGISTAFLCYPCACILACNYHYLFTTHSIHTLHSLCTATAGQIAVERRLIAHCAEGLTGSVIDKGPPPTGEERRPIHSVAHPHALSLRLLSS